MLERDLWRDFTAVTFSVAVLGIGVAGAVYTLSLIASGDYFSVAAVLWLIAVGFFVVLARRPIYRGRAT